MPKPFAQLTGNGCHVHASLWDKDRGQEPVLRHEGGKAGTSQLPALPFPRRRPALGRGAVRDLQPHRQQLQAPQRPDHAVRRHLGAQRDQLRRQQPHPHGAHIAEPAASSSARLMDGAANPYLTQAALLAAGTSDGIEHKRDPGKRLDINMYADGHRARGVGRSCPQPPRRDPHDPETPPSAPDAGRRARRQLRQAQAPPMGRLQRVDLPLGARADALGLLSGTPGPPRKRGRLTAVGREPLASLTIDASLPSPAIPGHTLFRHPRA